MSGLIADARTIIDHARVEAQVRIYNIIYIYNILNIKYNIIFNSFCAQNHWFTYNETIKVESVSQAVCDLALRFGESADGEESIMVNNFITKKKFFLVIITQSRPFGIALLIGGCDEKGPQL